MKIYNEISDEYANKRLIGARTKELMKNPLFKDVAEEYAQQRVNEVLDKAAVIAIRNSMKYINTEFVEQAEESYKRNFNAILKLKNK